MDLMIVCGDSVNAGLLEYALGAVLGLLVVIAMWTRQRHLAARPAGRQILSLK